MGMREDRIVRKIYNIINRRKTLNKRDKKEVKNSIK